MELKLPGTYSFRKNHVQLNNLKWLVSKTVGDIAIIRASVALAQKNNTGKLLDLH